MQRCVQFSSIRNIPPSLPSCETVLILENFDKRLWFTETSGTITLQLGAGELSSFVSSKLHISRMVYCTAAWLAQLVEPQSAVREVEDWTNAQGVKITEENVLPLQLHLQMVRRSSLLVYCIFSVAWLVGDVKEPTHLS